MMILSGVNIDSDLRGKMKNNCRLILNGTERNTKVSQRCFIATYREYFKTSLASVPEFASYAMSLPSGLRSNDGGAPSAFETAAFEKMMLALLTGTGWIDDHTGWVRFGDLELVPHLIQYLEVTMARFDQDRNGFIDRNEAMTAYPLYKPLLTTVAPSGFTSDKILRAAFAYVLVYQNLPQTFADKIKFIGIWANEPTLWPVWASRADLAGTLAYIQILLDQQHTPSPPPALTQE